MSQDFLHADIQGSELILNVVTVYQYTRRHIPEDSNLNVYELVCDLCIQLMGNVDVCVSGNLMSRHPEYI